MNGQKIYAQVDCVVPARQVGIIDLKEKAVL